MNECRTILDRLGFHAATHGDKTAFTFLRSDDERIVVTYRELNQRARSIARELLNHAQSGDRALMTYPAGLGFIEAFLGCLYAGIIAVPAYPPKKNRNAERILAMAHDCQPRLLLCASDTRGNVEGEFAALVEGAIWLVTDEIGSNDGDGLPTIDSQQVAFLQYTSGSTASPKGVMVTHANVVANEVSIQHNFQHTTESLMVSWLPMFHDMGLIGGILQPLFVGFPSVLMAPNTFLSDPVVWLRAITEFGGTSAGGPNFAYEHCVRKVTLEQRRSLDLSTWKTAYNGAEPVRAETLKRFATAFSSCGFRSEAFFPCYGLAEVTLFVSGGPALVESPIVGLDADELECHRIREATPETERVQESISCGQIGTDLDVRIVNPETSTECAADQVGEVWLHGASIAAGYWNRPEEKTPVFQAKIAGDQRSWFRTGDYGFLRDGELYITGRLKDLIIIRGRNIYPQDVERAVERVLPFVEANSCAAFSVVGSASFNRNAIGVRGFSSSEQSPPTPLAWGLNNDGTEKLAVVIEANRELVRTARAAEKDAAARQQLDALVAAVREAIGDEFEIAVDAIAFLRPATFPRTSSGKVQRRACRELLQKGSEDFIHVWQSKSNPHRVDPIHCGAGLKGQDSIAQGNALGSLSPQSPSPEGARQHGDKVSPLQGFDSISTVDPGRCPGLSNSDPSGLKTEDLPSLPDSPVRGVAGATVHDALRQLLHDKIVGWLRSELDQSVDSIGEDVSFMSLGVDSVGAVEIALTIEQATGLSLSPETIYEYRTLRELTAYLEKQPDGGGATILPSRIVVDRIETERDILEVALLRYEVNVNEMGLAMRYADHHDHTVLEPLDASGHIFAARVDNRIVGTVRTHLLRESDIGFYYKAYGVPLLPESVDRNSVSITTRLAVLKEFRGSRVTLLLQMAAYQFNIKNGITHDIIDCRPRLVPSFERLGYRPHIPSLSHPEFGNVVVQALSAYDERHLAHVRSPFLNILRSHKNCLQTPQ